METLDIPSIAYDVTASCILQVRRFDSTRREFGRVAVQEKRGLKIEAELPGETIHENRAAD